MLVADINKFFYSIILFFFSIVGIYMPRNPKLNKHQTYAFIKFTTKEDAQNAIDSMNNIKIYRKRIVVRKGILPFQGLHGDSEIMVENFDNNVDTAILNETFSRFGEILEISKIMKMKNIKYFDSTKHYAFIRYNTLQECNLALEFSNNIFLFGYKIKVTYSERNFEFPCIEEDEMKIIEKFLKNEISLDDIIEMNENKSDEEQQLNSFSPLLSLSTIPPPSTPELL